MRVLLVVYDNESYIHFFPQGIAYIAAVLRKAGHEVSIYNQDMHHYPDAHLTQYLDEHPCDVLGVGVIGGYFQYHKLLGIAKAVNQAKHRPFFIIGGHGPSPDPAYFMRKTQADAVVMGEGEETIVELLQAISGSRSFESVQGIAAWKEGKVYQTSRRPLIADIDTIPQPAYDLFPMEYYRLMGLPHKTACDFVMPVLSGRGCTFKCTFCYRMDKGFRPRSAEPLIEEIQQLQRDYGITYVTFSDELLMSSVQRTAELCEAFLKAELKFKWFCNGRLNYAKPDLLKLMRRAGCVFVNYGIEAMDNNVLRNMHKSLLVEQIVPGIEATLQAGISPGFNIIFGNIGDNVETLNKGVEFLLQYDDGAQLRTIRPVTPYPGSPLYYEAIKRGLVKDCEDFYEHKHFNSDLLSVNFTEMTDDEFHQALLDANTRLIENYFARKANNAVREAKELYLKRDASFRGFRQL